MACRNMAMKLKNKNTLLLLPRAKKDGELYIGAFLLSEPEAGSDATSQKTYHCRRQR
jgi:alkylation response protein AidB-like acyl-CoA dehydrogenase